MYKTSTEANEDLEKFAKEFEEFLKAYKFDAATVVVHGEIAKSGPFLWNYHSGDNLKEAPMAAWHFGMATSEHNQMIQQAAKSGQKQAGERQAKMFE